MHIHVITIFPELFGPFLETGIVGRARRSGLVRIAIHDLRQHTHDRRRSVDDAPFGGGPGMVMTPGPLFEAVESLSLPTETPIVMLTPRGRLFDQPTAERLAQKPSLVLICGRYEGVDERVHDRLATEEISTGDYVVTGGELPALIVLDAVVRLRPGALGHGEEAVADDSHTSGLLQYPQYTRPADFRGLSVPDVLLSGDHTAIARWRRQESLRRTLERRPDLLPHADLSEADLEFLRGCGWQSGRGTNGS